MKAIFLVFSFLNAVLFKISAAGYIPSVCVTYQTPNDPPPCPKGSKCKPPPCGSPVFLDNGAFFVNAEDLRVPAPGKDLVVSRQYDHTLKRTDAFSPGWVMNVTYRAYMTETPFMMPIVIVYEGFYKAAFSRLRYQGYGRALETGSALHSMIADPARVGNFDFTNVGGGDATLSGNFPANHSEMVKGSERFRFMRSKTDPFRMLLVKEHDFLSNIHRYTYDDQDRLVRISDNITNAFIDFSYNEENQLVLLQDMTGRQVHYGYAGGLLSTVTDPRGFSTRYEYGDTLHPTLVTRVFNRNQELEYEAHYDQNAKLVEYLEYGKSVGVSVSGSGVVENFPDGRITKALTNSEGDVECIIRNDTVLDEEYFDQFQRLIFEKSAGLQQFAYAYDGYNNQIQKKLIPTPVTVTVPPIDSAAFMQELTRVVSVNSQAVESICYDELTQSNFVCYVSTESVQETTRSIPTIRSANWESGVCETRGALSFLGEFELKVLTHFNRLQPRTRALPYFRLSPEVDPEQCIYLDPTTMPGLLWQTEYQRFGQRSLPVKETDPDGFVTQYFYDGKGQRIREISPAGIERRWDYDSNGRVIRRYEGGELVDSMTYDPIHGRLVSQTDASGYVTQYCYDQLGNRTCMVDREGQRTDYEFDANQNLVRQILPADSAGNRPQWVYTYDGENRQIAVQDPTGRVTQSEYNQSGQLVREVLANGSERNYSYDFERLIRETNERGFTREIQYNLLDHVVSETGFHGLSRNYIRDVAGNVLAESDYSQRVTSMTYNALFQKQTQTYPNGATSYYEYLSGGAMTLFSDADGVTTLYSHQGGELLTRSVQLGSEPLITRYGYDSRGRQVVTTSPGQNTTMTTLDERGDTTEILNPLGHRLLYSYDGMQRQISQSNELSHTWTTLFDNLGREVAQTSPLGHTQTKTYDLASRLLTKTWPEQNRQSIGYDLLGYPQTISWYRADNSLESTVTLSHDAAGNLLSVASEGIEILRSFDAMNRLTFINIPALQRQIILELDGDGRRLSRMLLNTSDQSFELTQYSYDSAGRLSEMRDGELLTRFSYTPAGRISQILYPNGIIRNSSYDEFGRLVSLSYSLDSQILQTQAFEYDADSRRIREHSQNGTTSYTYDNKGQLLSVQYPNGQWEQFSYDAAGNKTTMSSDQLSRHFTFDAENRLISSSDYQNTWNENGWLVSRKHSITQTETFFDYNARGKLTAVRYSDGTSSTFTYYPESDLRFASTSPEGVTSRFLFDGQTEFMTLSAQNQSLSTITALPDTYDDRLFQRTSDGDLQTWLTDHLSSVRKTVINTADLSSAKTFAYYAFGSLRAGDPLSNLDFGYTGRTLDLPANLYYYRGRMMDSCSGTFTQVDPMQDGSNWTAYVGGDPISNNDASGYIAGVDDAVIIVSAATLSALAATAVIVGVVAYGTHVLYKIKLRRDAAPKPPPPVYEKKKGQPPTTGGQPVKGGHSSNASPSKKGKHEKGEGRRGCDQFGEKGDRNRPYKR